MYHQGTIDAFMFPEVDRQTRNSVVSIPILKLALNAGVPVYFAEEMLYLTLTTTKQSPNIPLRWPATR